MSRIKIGVLGAGHLGKIHIRLLKEIEAFDLVGFYDPNEVVAEKISAAFDIPCFASIADLIEAVDAVDIVSPTVTHYENALKAVQAGKHIFVEKPLVGNLEESHLLLEAVEKAGVKAQVGHVERFNPAFLPLKDLTIEPLFIEVHRLAQFNPRGTDVSVVLDLMIHDLDIILSLVSADVAEVRASGVSIVSKSADIANARIEFVNGCVANVTASRMSLKNMRKTRIFQSDAYVSVDFLEKTTEIVRLSEEEPTEAHFALNVGENQNKKYITFSQPNIEPNNAIQMELRLFADSILQNKPIAVSVRDGHRALQLAYQIMAAMEESSSKVVTDV